MIDCVGTNWIFYACIVLASILSVIPFLGKFLNVLNTMIHESGHAIAALVTGGGVMNIKLSADTSGAAQTKSKYWIGKVFTSLAGYPVSSATALLFFWLIQEQKINYIFIIIISLILINLILWVRNAFGIIWLVVMGIICTLVYIYTSAKVKHYFVVFCAAIVLFQSVYSSITLLVIAIKNPSKSGDAKNLKDFTFLPSFIWAFLFVAIALFSAYTVLLMMPCLSNF
jgi:hypothetical protein